MTVEEKRGALEAALQSRVLRRCEQLRRMLQFICELEFEGRSGELNEYLIGVEALGRPASYNPAEDSIVRTRAYELRNKLAKYYATEAPDAPVRIEIDRGAYVPRFVRQLQQVAFREATALPPPVAEVRERQSRPAVALVAICIAMAAGAFAFFRLPAPQAARTDAWTPDLEAFWKPFLASDAPLVLTYDSRLFLLAPPLQLIVRNWRTNEVADVGQNPDLVQFKDRMGADKLVESRNYADFGIVHAVFHIMQTAGRRQSQISLAGAKDLDWADMFNNNIVYVGGIATANPRLKKVLETADFVERIGGVANLRPTPGEAAFYPISHPKPTGSNDGEKFAVLSRCPGPQRGRYIMLLGSVHSELPWAMAEYITNPLSMRELMSHLKQPSGEIPEAFQVLLRVTLQSQVPVRIRYATHHVVKTPEFTYQP